MPENINDDDNTTSSSLLRAEDGTMEEEYRGEEARPKEPWGGEYVKSIVYAGLDAIITSFSLISSISGGSLSSVDVLVLGFANLVADGISMGFADFVSSSTEMHMAVKQRKITQWDVNNDLNQQVHQLLERYTSLGMNVQDATVLVNILAKYKEILIDEKMATEKGILPPDNNDSTTTTKTAADKPWKHGLVTLAAFLVFGSAPLLAFIVLIPFTSNQMHKFIGASVFSALALVLLGAAKANIAGQNYLLSTATTLFNGAIAAATAYAIGWALRNVAGLED